MITSPKATFQSIVAHPRWLGMLLLTCAAVSVLVGGFLMTKIGQDAWLDAAANSPFSRGQMSDQQYAGMSRMAPYVDRSKRKKGMVTPAVVREIGRAHV